MKPRDTLIKITTPPSLPRFTVAMSWMTRCWPQTRHISPFFPPYILHIDWFRDCFYQSLTTHLVRNCCTASVCLICFHYYLLIWCVWIVCQSSKSTGPHVGGLTFITYWHGYIGNGVYAVDSRLRNGVFILGSLLNCRAPTVIIVHDAGLV